jgi:hypothetical protein
LRVLIVEDEARLAAYLQRGLEREGYAVDVAGDGEQGLWQASNATYDAVVLDIASMRAGPAAPAAPASASLSPGPSLATTGGISGSSSRDTAGPPSRPACRSLPSFRFGPSGRSPTGPGG